MIERLIKTEEEFKNSLENYFIDLVKEIQIEKPNLIEMTLYTSYISEEEYNLKISMGFKSNKKEILSLENKNKIKYTPIYIDKNYKSFFISDKNNYLSDQLNNQIKEILDYINNKNILSSNYEFRYAKNKENKNV